MPLFIENTTIETTVIDQDMPLTEAQIEKLVKLIMQRLATEARDQQSRRSATRLRNESLPDSE
ncbi:MAG: hypothetical protein J0M07_17285 [Anaerolineae bacterium]|nr:hypothetical protein [Chloroflexota bacterium]MBN8637084.1 hypothetical protein [Anaerolineae bacterium]